MLKDILVEIDAEIARLQQVRSLLNGAESKRSKSSRPGPTGVTKPRKRWKLSPEAREKIRQAQLKRWAAAKKKATTKPAK